MDVNATLFENRTLVFFHTHMTKDDLKKNTVIDFPDAKEAYTGAIPGLFIFDDFVTNDFFDGGLIQLATFNCTSKS